MESLNKILKEQPHDQSDQQFSKALLKSLANHQLDLRQLNRMRFCFQEHNYFSLMYLPPPRDFILTTPTHHKLFKNDEVVQYIHQAPYPTRFTLDPKSPKFLSGSVVAMLLDLVYRDKSLNMSQLKDFSLPPNIVTHTLHPTVCMAHSYVFWSCVHNPLLAKSLWDVHMLDKIPLRLISKRNKALIIDSVLSQSVVYNLTKIQMKNATSMMQNRKPVCKEMHEFLRKQLLNWKFSDYDFFPSPILIVMCYMPDGLLARLTQSEFARLYQLRSIYSLNKGYKGPNYYKNYDQPIAQSAIATSFSEMMSTAGKKTIDVLQIITDKINEIFKSIRGFFTDKWSSACRIIKNVKDDVIEILKVVFSKAIGYTMFNTEKLNKAIHALCWILSLAFLATTGFLAWKTVTQLMKGHTNIPEPEVTAQGVDQSVPWLLMATSSILGISISERSFGYTTITRIMKVISFGSVGLSMAAVILNFLPASVTIFLTEHFGSRYDKLKLISEDWIIQCIKMHQIGQDPRIFRKKHFRRMVTELHEQGLKLLIKVKNEAPLMRIILPTYQKISKTYTHVRQYEKNDFKRDEPFSIHVSAKPGTAKSLLAQTMIRDIAGYPIEDLWYSSMDGEYTVGYLGHPVMIYDEFLVGNQEDKQKQAKDYLSLISTSEHRPNFASIDNPNVGIKGDTIAPNIVLTLNNHPYNRVEEIDDQALQRRRHVNIQLSRVERVTGNSDENTSVKVIPFQLLSKDQIKNKTVIVGRIIPSVYSTDTIKGPWIPYDQLIEEVRKLYMEHKETANKIREALDLGPEPEVNLDQMVNDAMATAYGVDDQSKSLLQRIGSFFNVAQSDEPNVNEEEEDTEEELTEELKNIIKQNVARQVETVLDVPDQTSHQILAVRKYSKQLDSYARSMFNAIFRSKDPNDVAFCNKITHDQWVIIKRGITRTPKNKIEDLDKIMALMVERGFWLSRYDLFSEIVFEQTPDEEEYNTSIEFTERCLQLIQRDINHFNRDLSCVVPFMDFSLWPESVKSTSSFLIPTIIGLSSVVILVGTSLCKFFMDHKKSNSDELTAHSDKKDRQSTRARKSQQLTNMSFKAQNQSPWTMPTINIVVSFEKGHTNIKAVPIFDRAFLTYYHWLKNLSKLGKIESMTLHYKYKTVTVPIDNIETMECRDSDIMIIRFKDNAVPQHKNCCNKFLRADEYYQLRNCQVMLAKEDGNQFSMMRREDCVSYMVPLDNSNVCLIDPMVYYCKTNSGDCGNLVVAADGLFAGRYLGIHVAGHSMHSKAYGTPVFQETIKQAEEWMADYQPSKWGNPDTKDFNGPYQPAEFNQSRVEVEPDVILSQGVDGDLFDTLNTLHKKENFPNLHILKKNHKKTFMSTKTKIKKSIFYGKVDYQSSKSPAILTSREHRAKGQNPVMNTLLKLFRAKKGTYDLQILKQVKDELIYKLDQVLDFSVSRTLTIEEACGGVPGLLSSINTRSSPGFPLMTFSNSRKGKQDYIRFEGQDLIIDPIFRNLVQEKIRLMESGEDFVNYFVAYLKDELRPITKIEAVSTRITYCNDLVSLVAMRMKFGGVLIAFNRSFTKTGYAIGINQYSFDMNKVYELLRWDNNDQYLDGDFSGYDLTLSPYVLTTAYEVLRYFAVTYCDCSMNESKFLSTHELKALTLIGDIIFQSDLNLSGCLFTSIINCIANDINFRYIFRIDFPALSFDDWVKCCFLGDDNVISIQKGLPWTPHRIQQSFAKIGMKYTNADKEDELANNYKRFADITFLGAHPIQLDGPMYCGRMKLETIMESIQYTRNDNVTIVDEAIDMIEKMSLYPEDLYNKFLANVKQALELEGLFLPVLKSYTEYKRIVPNRTTIDIPIAMSSSPEIKNTMNNNSKPTANSNNNPKQQPLTRGNIQSTIAADIDVSPVVDGLTTLTTDHKQPATDYELSKIRDNGHNAINERAMDLSFGLDSLVKRATINWSSTNVQGDILASYSMPWGILSQGNVNNIQNMPFNNFIYFVGDIELVFQVNGTPTQAGMVVAYHVPLSDGLAYYDEWLTFNNVLLTPADNCTKSIIIPFRFWRAAMNTYAGPLGEENLGNVNLGVFVPLASLGVTTATITVYTKFHQAKFTIPRPLAAQGDVVIAQGNTSSNYVNYSFGSIAGNVPIEAKIDASNPISASASMPLDNPPITGCSIPIAGVYPSMSKNYGLEPTVSMQHHPEMLNREAHKLTDPMVSDINNILGRRFHWGSFTWDSNLAIGAPLFDIPLNTMCLDDTAYAFDAPVSLGFALLSQFARWRADMVFEFYVNRTVFHSGRLLATTAYGAPTIPAGTENVFYNQVLDFNSDNYWATVKVAYNASTEFLRTYEGPGMKEKVLDHSLGRLKLTVMNPLKVTSTIVPTSVNLRAFVRFENVRVYELKLTPIAQLDPYYPPPTLTAQGADIIAQGDEVVEVDNGAPSADLHQGATTTNQESVVVSDKPYSLQTGRKYEYTITNLLEVMRRHYEIGSIEWLGSPLYSSAPPGSITGYFYKLEVKPHHRFNTMFAAWSGHMKYRVIVNTTLPIYYTYVTNGTVSTGSTDVLDAGALARDYFSSTSFVGTNPQRILTVLNTRSYNNIPWEVAYPTSGNQAMIDISVPFNTHLKYLPCKFNDRFGGSLPVGTYNFSNGYIAWIIPTTTIPAFKTFEAVGDDFRYHLWRPEVSSRLRPYRGTGTPLPGDIVGDNFF